MEKLNILIVDDHPVFRAGLISIFKNLEFQLNIFEASNSKEMFSVLNNNEIDLVTLDINLPGTDGMQLLKKIRKINKEIKIFIITMYRNVLLVEQSIAYGANGFICKDNIYENLITGIKKILNNENFIDPTINFTDNQDIEKKAELYFLLTESEKKIFKLLAEGHNYKKIANLHCRSHKTIDNQRTSIMNKMQIKNVTELVKIAIKLNIIKI